ncbi:amidase [Sinimarinibacterium sp. CAU 1509]|uniref:cupredoxin domain-containing protein n=1 Tax=Sinimarinibacterium sp. CAU 1509 TaxID=2562283 RepID=UPI0010AD8836|nr:cupredoxin domain-containing protein [Sinimarinibacterium sp. CAU 1509]TJY59025.1 amidase [Sinimarinibacterium sp. CAU 1509]
MNRKLTLPMLLAGALAMGGIMSVAHAEEPAAVAGAAAEAKVIITADKSFRMFFEPAELTVPVGTTVTFSNEDGSNHKVNFSDGTQSDRLRHGAVYTRTFTAPGEYPYACAIHPKMTGKIIVR